MSESRLTDFDVLVNGAGLVGSCCALLLARSGIHVAILDKNHPSKEANPDPIRVSAINHASQNILEHLCVWRDIAWDKSTAFERIEVWDALSNGTISFDAATAGLSHLGHIVANNSLCTALHQTLGHCAEAVVRFGENLVDIESSENDTYPQSQSCYIHKSVYGQAGPVRIDLSEMDGAGKKTTYVDSNLARLSAIPLDSLIKLERLCSFRSKNV